ncbi:isoprenylcysteine carboxylmethyltransferase family protein [uncultured Sulfitobacter sp.]|uniref:methyltransferase family protein n=1 Tax=uncultured Sulfitobacter sp. TaxID=191468 RepID=UPI002627CA22|nr:isoprenylcysteine carboxylmethyltransferase family protein [uncultured Sulfitobacter sp.]
MQRVLPPLLLLLTLVVMIVAAYAWPVGDIIPQPLRWIGGLAAAIGLLIAAKGARLFRQVGTNIKTFDAPQKLVTTGLFALSRNPMYLGFALCSVGFAVALGAMSPLLVAALFCVTLDRWYVRFEEAVMQETFGAEYETYRARVRRWL